MRNFKNPPHISEVTAMLCKSAGIDLVYFNAKDIDVENNKINGRMLVGEKWVRVKTGIPKVIDISAFCVKHKREVNYLRNKSHLTDNLKKRISKNELQDTLRQDEKLSDYIIPTRRIESFKDIDDFIKRYGEIVIKPIYSRLGMGVYIIKPNDKDFTVGILQQEKNITYKELETLYNSEIKDKPHIIQKAMTSRTNSGDPFDCRVHLEKDGFGGWEVLNISARIGIGQKVISNISYGGGRAKIEPFLQNNYGDQWEDIHKNLNDFGLGVAKKMEKVRETELMTLGLDVGVDPDGNIFIFEANSAPGTDIIKSEVALTRTKYYKYLFKKYG